MDVLSLHLGFFVTHSVKLFRLLRGLLMGHWNSNNMVYERHWNLHVLVISKQQRNGTFLALDDYNTLILTTTKENEHFQN